MSLARRRALLLAATVIAALLVVSALAVRAGPEPLPARPPNERPTLLLLTSLPLVFGEDFSLNHNGSPALSALQARYQVVPISVTAPAELARGRLLLMAQPLAQPPEDLIALDAWVRRGGRLLLLADPALEWPSQRPLGDAARPPPMFMDTGLLIHWGVRLDAPDRRGPRTARLGGFDVLTDSPGQLFGRCGIGSERIVAHCPVGKGRSTIVADADLLDVARLGPNAKHNFDGVIGELAQLEDP